MSRESNTLEFREQAARVMTETGRPVPHAAASIGVGEQLLKKLRKIRLEPRSAPGASIVRPAGSDPRWGRVCAATRTSTLVWISARQQARSSAASKDRRVLDAAQNIIAPILIGQTSAVVRSK
ncbi:hypothetical protein [Mycolicibacterium gilvum]|uniref:hypothetical protein n=1 Tax=Mycolicibacterium gilvum TaxID=1804 RepID=UPI001559A437|nr:hypothetical protein [Mycolicibacterium gilvum]MCV7057109.1 hypothetical protein [Mycolicibacterium gilvum]